MSLNTVNNKIGKLSMNKTSLKGKDILTYFSRRIYWIKKKLNEDSLKSEKIQLQVNIS